MLALRCGSRLLSLRPVPRSSPLRFPAARTCSGGGARDPSAPAGNPLVYLDVDADGQPLGRVVLEVRPRPERAALRGRGPRESPAPRTGAVPGALRALVPHARALACFPTCRQGRRIGRRSPLGTLEKWRRGEGYVWTGELKVGS